MLPPSPFLPVLSLPHFLSWGPLGQRTSDPQRSRITSALSPQSLVLGGSEEQRAGPSDGAGRLASLTYPTASWSLFAGVFPHFSPWQGPGTLGTRPKRVSFLSFTASGQFFIVLTVSGFVLRNKKHFRQGISF